MSYVWQKTAVTAGHFFTSYVWRFCWFCLTSNQTCILCSAAEYEINWYNQPHSQDFFLYIRPKRQMSSPKTCRRFSLNKYPKIHLNYMIKRDICQYDMLIYLCITVYPFIRIMQVFFSFAMTFNDNSPFFQSLYAVFSVEQIRILAVFFVFGGRYKKESLKPMIWHFPINW